MESNDPFAWRLRSKLSSACSQREPALEIWSSERTLVLDKRTPADAAKKQCELLLQTLRVFFDVNCSHEAASQRLGVHRKTIARRLAKFTELTGLDLTTHDDRLVADLSLYVNQMLADRTRSPG